MRMPIIKHNLKNGFYKGISPWPWSEFTHENFYKISNVSSKSKIFGSVSMMMMLIIIHKKKNQEQQMQHNGREGGDGEREHLLSWWWWLCRLR